jgi:anti-sigma factor RsiW
VTEPAGSPGPGGADADRLARYALGELSPDDEARFEDALLDDDAWVSVQAAEDELVAAYASGGLDAARRQQIGDRIAASPRLRERLALTRDLQTIAAAPSRASVSSSRARR